MDLCPSSPLLLSARTSPSYWSRAPRSLVSPWIEVGTAHWFAPPPPLRTVRADLPHTAAPVNGFPKGTEPRFAGRLPTRSTKDRGRKPCLLAPPFPGRSAFGPSTPHARPNPSRDRPRQVFSRYSGNPCHHARVLSESIFLPPLAPPELPGFFATMAALTAARPGSPVVVSDSSPCFTSHRLPTIPPPTT